MTLRIVNVMASSLNGRIGAQALESDEERQSLGLSHPVDRKFLYSQIHDSDAVIVGASSLRASGSCIAEKGRYGRYPVWYILAKSPLPPELPFWRQKEIPRVLVSPSPLPIVVNSGVSSLIYEGSSPARPTVDALRLHKGQRVLLFGGGTVNKFFYDENLVDELKLTLSPLFIAGKHTPELIAPNVAKHVHFRLLSSHAAESFVFLDYQVVKS